MLAFLFIVEIDQKTTNLGNLSHFEEIRGSVEPWLMAGWKAHVDFLFVIVQTLFASSYG